MLSLIVAATLGLEKRHIILSFRDIEYTSHIQQAILVCNSSLLSASVGALKVCGGISKCLF